MEKASALSRLNGSAPSRPILGQSLEGMLPYPSTLSCYRARRRYLREARLAARPTSCQAASTARWLDKSLAVLSILSVGDLAI